MKVRRGSVSADVGDLLDQCLTAADTLLRDLAGSQLECETLQKDVEVQTNRWQYLFESIPVACIELDASGAIAQANRSAGVLLNTSTKHLESRLLMHFLDDRDAFTTLMRQLSVEREAVRMPLTLRPRERAPIRVHVTVMPQGPDRATTSSLWFLLPSESPREFHSGRQRKVVSVHGEVNEIAS